MAGSIVAPSAVVALNAVVFTGLRCQMLDQHKTPRLLPRHLRHHSRPLDNCLLSVGEVADESCPRSN
jgi:hypothetical protein